MTEFQISLGQINPNVVGTRDAKQQPRYIDCLLYRLAQGEQLPPGTECGNFGCRMRVGRTGNEVVLPEGVRNATVYCFKDQPVPEGIIVVM